MVTLLQTVEFREWITGMTDRVGRSLILSRLDRAAAGHFGVVAPVGDGVMEMKVNFGPGYRVYYKRVGGVVYLLLCGGDKSTQKTDIKRARAMASDVK